MRSISSNNNNNKKKSQEIIGKSMSLDFQSYFPLCPGKNYSCFSVYDGIIIWYAIVN
jgi:hypothetical protein